jgi:phospholipase/lecithinase/hemolysin
MFLQYSSFAQQCAVFVLPAAALRRQTAGGSNNFHRVASMSFAHRPLRRLLLLLAVLGGLLPALPASAASPFARMFVFGDSLADVGNTLILSQRSGIQPAIPPSASPHRTYFRGRFSNGPVAVEYLWLMLSGHPPTTRRALQPSLSVTRITGSQSLDFAFGGAGSGASTVTPGGFPVPGLQAQVDMFAELARGKGLAKQALFVIVVGSNDYLFAGLNGPIPPEQVVGNIGTAIRNLYALGGRNFLVLNLPDLGKLPLIAGSEYEAGLSGASLQHNALLAQLLTALPAELAGARIVPLDLVAIAQSLPPGLFWPPPALDALSPGTGLSTCLFVNPATCADAPTFAVDPRFFYWDAEHPTTSVHSMLGYLMYERLRRR